MSDFSRGGRTAGTYIYIHPHFPTQDCNIPAYVFHLEEGLLTADRRAFMQDKGRGHRFQVDGAAGTSVMFLELFFWRMFN